MWLKKPEYIMNTAKERILEFGGLNKLTVIADGDMRDMKNLSSDEYPCLSQRKSRGIFTDGAGGASNYNHPVQMISKNGKLAVLDYSDLQYTFFYDTFSEISFNERQHMVSINNKLCFFPSKKWFDVKTKETGSLESRFKLSESDTHAIVETQTDGCLITLNDSFLYDLGKLFAEKDAVRITGTLSWEGNEPGVKIYSQDAPISCIVNSVSELSIVVPSETFIELSSSGVSSGKITDLKIERLCPDIEFVIENNNRLWGVCNEDNTIRASKLGDPTNWEYFSGSSIDSYAATQGSDGIWTGCAAYSSHLLFFKENCIHRLYGSSPATYQITSTEANGIEEGSECSAVVIDDYVYYKSAVGIMRYAGGRPELISECFGNEKYKNAVAGTDGKKYYVSMINSNNEPEMLVYDTRKALWHREDSIRAEMFCKYNGELLFSDSEGFVWIIGDSQTIEDNELEWFAELGPFDEYIEDKKAFSKLKMRYSLSEGAYMEIWIQHDDGDWILAEELLDHMDRAGVVKVIPRRCDKFRIRLEGKGRCIVESILRQYRVVSGRR